MRLSSKLSRIIFKIYPVIAESGIYTMSLWHILRISEATINLASQVWDAGSYWSYLGVLSHGASLYSIDFPCPSLDCEKREDPWAATHIQDHLEKHEWKDTLRYTFHVRYADNIYIKSRQQIWKKIILKWWRVFNFNHFFSLDYHKNLMWSTLKTWQKLNFAAKGPKSISLCTFEHNVPKTQSNKSLTWIHIIEGRINFSQWQKGGGWWDA